jgi:hypothetical protein
MEFVAALSKAVKLKDGFVMMPSFLFINLFYIKLFCKYSFDEIRSYQKNIR